jgi:hypothetical protein
MMDTVGGGLLDRIACTLALMDLGVPFGTAWNSVAMPMNTLSHNKYYLLDDRL